MCQRIRDYLPHGDSRRKGKGSPPHQCLSLLGFDIVITSSHRSRDSLALPIQFSRTNTFILVDHGQFRSSHNPQHGVPYNVLKLTPKVHGDAIE